MGHKPRTRGTGLVLGALLAGAPALAGGTAPPQEATDEPLRIEARAVVPTVRTAPVAEDYRIGRQDLLEIRVFGVEELNQQVRVADDGSITLPLIGRLRVGGLSKAELERSIAERLGDRYVRNPQVTVFVREYESKKVAVAGAVKKPDTYEMLGQRTLLEMLSRAGGLDKDFGDWIYVFRRNGDGTTRRLDVDLERLVFAGDASLDVALEPGDIVYVPEAEKIRVFVSGAVKNEDLYEVPANKPVTVLKAITLAGGTTERAAERRVQIIRTGPGGERIVLAVDLRKVRRGKAEDPVLQDDDIVVVPESFF